MKVVVIVYRYCEYYRLNNVKILKAGFVAVPKEVVFSAGLFSVLHLETQVINQYPCFGSGADLVILVIFVVGEVGLI